VKAPRALPFLPLEPGRLRIWHVATPGRQWQPSEGSARWNRRDQPVIYASTTAGLAMLEARAHLKSDLAARWHRLCAVYIAVSRGDALQLMPQQLPHGWKKTKRLTRRIAAAWLAESNATFLLVPSVLVPGDSNVLINSGSQRWNAWRAAATEQRVRFDVRLVRSPR
jgi:RES domain-containing protein